MKYDFRMVLSFQLLFDTCLYCLPLCNIPGFIKRQSPPLGVRLGMYSAISIFTGFMWTSDSCLYRGVFLFVQCMPSGVD